MNWQVKQQINFYTDDFKPPQLPKEIAYVLLGVVINVVVMLLLTLLSWGYEQWEKRQLNVVQQQETFLQQQIEQVMSERPTLEVDSALEQRKAQSQKNLEGSRKILSYLTQGHLKQSHSYSNKITQLGDQSIEGVWLQRFVIADQGQRVILQGFLDDPSKLSPYISTLVEKSAYQDVSFRFIDVQKQEDHSWLLFELDTHTRDDNSEDSIVTTRRLVQGES